MNKKLLCIILALVLVFSALPVTLVSAATEDEFKYTVYYGRATITEYTGSATELVIPATLGGCPVITIGAYAFYYCKSLTSVTIPDSVTTIGEGAFSYCTSLASVTIPDGVTTIGSIAFIHTAYYNDDSNWENGVLYIGNYLIECKSTVSGGYAIKDGTKTIAEDAFLERTNLTSVTIPNSVTTIGAHAFYYCKSLTSVTIPDSVTTIGGSAFRGCTSLTSVTIPT